MNMKIQPVSFLKHCSVALSVFTMCLSPVAQGAKAAVDQKQKINRYLKETGLTTKKMKISEYWKMVRHVYPPKFQKNMDQWVAKNPQQMMPNILATSFKDRDGKEQVRLTLTKNSETLNVVFTGDEEYPVKYGTIAIKRQDLLDPQKFEKLPEKIQQQAQGHGKNSGHKSAISYEVFEKMKPRQKAEYLVRLRLVLEATQRVFDSRVNQSAYQEPENKYEWAFNTLFADFATAKGGVKAGDPCIVAGYLSVYGEGGSCGGKKLGDKDLKKQMSRFREFSKGCQSSVICNPLVYGFNGNSAYCVPKNNVKFATADCNGQSRLDGPNDTKNIERIVNSYMQNAEQMKEFRLAPDKDGKIPEDQKIMLKGYLADLKSALEAAKSACTTAPLSEITKAREDQASACEELQKRYISLEAYVNKTPAATPPPAENPPPVEDPNPCKGDEYWDGETCIPNGKAPEGSQEKKTCFLGLEASNTACGVGLALGLAAVGGLVWWLTSDDEPKKAPVYVPPAPVPGTVDPTDPVVPPVQPPPPAPCPVPNTLVNNVCVPPVVVPPPVSPGITEGGDKTGSPIGGGVRATK